METSGLLPRSYISSRRKAGIEYTLHLIIERIYTSFGDSNNPIATVLSLDISRAFNNVSYQIMLYNLWKRRVPLGVVGFIKGFLIYRHTTIKIPEYTSGRFDTPTRIP